jgi:hypothetical protein
MEVLGDLPNSDRQSFMKWLQKSGLAKVWQT